MKQIFATCCFILAAQIATAQKSMLKFDIDNCTNFSHSVETVKVIDMRANPDAIIGRIKKGFNNREMDITTAEPLPLAIENYYLRLSAAAKTKSNSKLLILLHTFYASEEKPGFASESAFFKLDAEYFISEGDGQYRLLGAVDTNVYVQSFDVTQKLFRTIDNSLCGIYESLYNSPLQTALYSYDQVLDYENEQKKIYPAYNTMQLEDGVYSKWEDFIHLNKKANEFVELKKGKFKHKYYNAKGKARSAPMGYVKVFVYAGKPYYVLDGKPREMSKKENDFYFTGRSNRFIISQNTTYVGVGGAAGMLFVPVGSSRNPLFEVKISYKNGQLIPVKRLDDFRRW